MTNPPVLASGRHEPKRPRSLPKPIREMIVLMVRGDDAGQQVDFVEAARMVGLRPQDVRKRFDDPVFLQALRAERKAWRALICASNETALKRARDHSANAMAQIAAVRCLEDLTEREVQTSRGTQQSPGIVINIVAAAPTIEAQPVAALEHAERVDVESAAFDPSRPAFDPDR